MVTTRSSSPQTDEDSKCSVDASISAKVVVSDPSKAIKIIICPNKNISFPIIHLSNPKNGSPTLYVVSKDVCAEVNQCGEDFRSWFYGDDVVENGVFRLYSPIHPLFLAIPYFLKCKGKFAELDEILTDPLFPSLRVLQENDQLLRNLKEISDIKDICEVLVYRLNEEKMMQWLKTRLEKIKHALLVDGSLHKGLTQDVEAMDRYSFGVLCDYLPAEIVDPAKAYLNIVDAAVATDEKTEMTYKRKAEEEIFFDKKAASKKAKESTVKKQLAQASKGTKSISSFFSKK